MAAALPRMVIVKSVPIELCQLLKFSGLAGSGGDAKALIADGRVSLNGSVETRKRKQVMTGDQVTFDGQTVVVSLR